MSSAAGSDTSHIALYVRVARTMTERIQRGEWRVGESIPIIEELCEQFSASRNTVRQALGMLSQAGLIVAARGRPTIVRAARAAELDDPKRLHAAINDPAASIDIQILSRKAIKAPPEVLTDGAELFGSYVWYRKVQSVGKRPYVLAEFFIAEHVADGFERGAERKAKFDLLLQKQNAAPLAWKRQLIATAHADEVEARLMGCEMGATVMDVRRWWHDRSGRLICVSASKYRAEDFVFEVFDRSMPSSKGKGW